ncbi:MAG: branched-chain amino acid ABC transporter permease [Acidocella sp. 20-61-6]|nr:MAG: branched-chain amino acid ABC transporter permease [Acidocella sp. 20-61-6]
MFWLNQILQGVLLGGYYALLAAGLSFLFGVMRVINLAHGSLVVLGAFLMLVIYGGLGISPLGGLLVMLPVMALLGVALQLLIIEPSLKGGALVPLLATFGLSLILDNVLFSMFGADTRSFAADIGNLSYASWNLGSIYVSQLACLVFAAAILVLGGTQLLLSRTQIGRRIRATAEDEDAARLSGVDTRLVRTATTALAMVMVGLAGAALGASGSFDPYAGGPQLLYAFEAVVIGGTGSLWGTLIGGITLGVAQGLGGAINTHLSQIAGHAVFLAVLIVRLRMGGALSAYLNRLRVRFA